MLIIEGYVGREMLYEWYDFWWLVTVLLSLCLDVEILQVVKADDSIGPEVEKLVASLPDGGVLLLENVRFYKEEEKNDPEHAKKLASLADLYVNDAFGTAHRAHASTEGVTKYLKPSVAGFLLQKVFISSPLLHDN